MTRTAVALAYMQHTVEHWSEKRGLALSTAVIRGRRLLGSVQEMLAHALPHK